MDELVTYDIAEGIARIVIDDGKRNAMSADLLALLHRAFERAEGEARAVTLIGRPGVFSAGFDLQVFARRDPLEIHDMVRLGAELALRLFAFPLPVVVGCTGHAYPMGAFLMLASDFCIGTEGPYLIGLNEVAIGLAIPRFAVELSRAMLTPPYFNRIVTAQMLDPGEARDAGFVASLVDADALDGAVRAKAHELAALDPIAFRMTKSRVRSVAAAAIRRAIDEEITLDHYRRAAVN
ncbi:crotonase/enoyl-CoA hydratase family protein [Novosphingobium sp.]|uniref:crotonase/enoyl-CoA hydratase family protein n=1 Tax=Novosphingobium sp. TaxID=1874826 RepID=UPI002736AFBA|nr:crotonase/enoyl-CoA hydratase family protein [Novosphingobium sp.]MDP3906717.1 crotonase/enoyl-CoA hydratase family protein [Novosphingobium sp.]